MDLSEALQALTKAVEENTRVLLAAQYGMEPEPAKAAPKKAAVMPPVPEGQQKAAPPALSYEANVKPVALQLAAAKGRDALIALLSDYQVAKATELPSEAYPDFIARAKAQLV